MAKTYKTSSGTFSEQEMVVAIWFNPKKKKARPNARLLETLTSHKSRHPLAFPLSILSKIAPWMSYPVARDQKEVDKAIYEGLATKESPILVPLPLARQHFGWEEFYVPEKYEVLDEC